MNLSNFDSTVDAKNYNTNYMVADLINVANGPSWNGKSVAPSSPAVVNGKHHWLRVLRQATHLVPAAPVPGRWWKTWLHALTRR